jgi:hypothetical protein
MEFLFGFIVGVISSAITIAVLIRIFKRKMERNIAKMQNQLLGSTFEQMFPFGDKINVKDVKDSYISINTK